MGSCPRVGDGARGYNGVACSNSMNVPGSASTFDVKSSVSKGARLQVGSLGSIWMHSGVGIGICPVYLLSPAGVFRGWYSSCEVTQKG